MTLCEAEAGFVTDADATVPELELEAALRGGRRAREWLRPGANLEATRDRACSVPWVYLVETLVYAQKS